MKEISKIIKSSKKRYRNNSIAMIILEDLSINKKRKTCPLQTKDLL